MDFSRLLPLMQGMQQGGGRAEIKPLVSFKAGMMNFDTLTGSNKLRIAADPRKGLLQLEKDVEGMVHIKWVDRSSGATGLDRVVFPHDVTFKRIRTGKDTDRVYELKYTANNNRFFFYMQEPKIEVDEENVKKFIEGINNPTAGGAGTEEGGTTGTNGSPGTMDPQMMSMLQALGIDSNTLGGMGGGRPGRTSVGPRGSSSSTTRPSTTPAANSTDNQLAQALQQSLGINAPINLPTVPSATTTSSSGTGTTGVSSSSSTATSNPPSTATVTSPTPAPAPAPSTTTTANTPGNAGQDMSIEELMALDPELAEALRLSMMESNNNNDTNNNDNNGGQVVPTATPSLSSVPSSSSTSSTTVPSTHTAAVPPSNGISYDELARAMQAITASGLLPGLPSSSNRSQRRTHVPPVRQQGITPLPYVLNMDTVENILTGRNSTLPSDEQENDSLALQSVLLPLLPADQQTLPHLLQILRSPQLRQAMLSLTGALDTENANIIFSNFNLRPEDGDSEMARGDAVGALVSAMNREAERNRNTMNNDSGSTTNTGSNTNKEDKNNEASKKDNDNGSN